MSTDLPPRRLAGTKEAATVLGIQRSTLSHWVSRGRVVPAQRLANGAMIFDLDVIEALRDELGVVTAPPTIVEVFTETYPAPVTDVCGDRPAFQGRTFLWHCPICDQDSLTSFPNRADTALALADHLTDGHCTGPRTGS